MNHNGVRIYITLYQYWNVPDRHLIDMSNLLISIDLPHLYTSYTPSNNFLNKNSNLKFIFSHKIHEWKCSLNIIYAVHSDIRHYYTMYGHLEQQFSNKIFSARKYKIVHRLISKVYKHRWVFTGRKSLPAILAINFFFLFFSLSRPIINTARLSVLNSKLTIQTVRNTVARKRQPSYFSILQFSPRPSVIYVLTIKCHEKYKKKKIIATIFIWIR